MSRFITDKRVEYRLSETETIFCRSAIPFDELLEVLQGIDQANPTANLKIAMPLLQLAIIDWNLNDEEGKVVPCTKDAIKQLHSEVILEMLPFLVSQYFPDAKKAQASGE